MSDPTPYYGVYGLQNRRATVLALEAFRDAMAGLLDEDEYDLLGEALAPFTDHVLHGLAKVEQGDSYVPYPHPHGTFSPAWWQAFSSDAVVPSPGAEP